MYGNHCWGPRGGVLRCFKDFAMWRRRPEPVGTHFANGLHKFRHYAMGFPDGCHDARKSLAYLVVEGYRMLVQMRKGMRRLVDYASMFTPLHVGLILEYEISRLHLGFFASDDRMKCCLHLQASRAFRRIPMVHRSTMTSPGFHWLLARAPSPYRRTYVRLLACPQYCTERTCQWEPHVSKAVVDRDASRWPGRIHGEYDMHDHVLIPSRRCPMSVESDVDMIYSRLGEHDSSSVSL